MTAIDKELIGAIYALYGWECLHWLKGEQVAFTRWIHTWHQWQIDDHSFTLLNRMPYVVNPISIRPAWIVYSAEPGLLDIRKAERLFCACPRLLSVSAVASIFLILIVVPLVVGTGLLPFLWRELAAVIAINQICAGWMMHRAMKAWGRSKELVIRRMLEVSLNPIAAARSADIAAVEIFQSRGI
ncbi:MAG: hypothetical protein P4L10_05395 [Acidobacteriaceae bacterium]|nr:hypothetical protein [Acidobacteriaceae bacterium]